MSCAAICLSHDYDGSNAFFRAVNRTARKNYKCCECYRPIEPGHTYEYAVGKSDGSMFTERTCVDCAEIRDAFTDGSFVFGYLWESVGESMFPEWERVGPWDCLAKLSTPISRCIVQRAF